jgi:predicted dehydrogenase
MRIGLIGIDSSHAEDFIRHFNIEARYPDLRVTALWARDARAARYATLTAMSSGIAAASSLQALLDAVDAVIVGDRDGRLHAAHALPAIAAGKPVFVDKPLSNGLADAERIVNAASMAGVALLSGSALRWAGDTQMLKRRLEQMEGPLKLEAHGTWYPDSEYGGAIFYGIHTIELVLELLGTDWSGLGLSGGPIVHCRYANAEASLRFEPLGASGSSAFGVSVTSGDTHFEQAIALPRDYMLPVVDRVAAMLRTGRSGMSPAELLAPLRMMEEIEALLPVSQA